MASVEIRDLGKCHPQPDGQGRWVLRHVTFTVAEGEFLALVGPSGAGKSTLLRLVAGLDEPSEGEVILGGRPLAGVEPGNRDVGMVFQNHALYPHLTAFENMSLALRLRKVPRREIEDMVREAAAMLGIEPLLKRQPFELSSGEKQRVALGRALARRPKVLLLDEPFSNLDAPCRARTREEVLKVHQRLRITTLHVTHDQAEAMAMGHRVAVLDQGHLRQCGDPESIYTDPADLFVAGFIGSPPMNLIPGRLVMREGLRWFCAEGELENGRLEFQLAPPAGLPATPLEGQAVCGIRPEHLHCTLLGGGVDGQSVATVERVEKAGGAKFLHLLMGVHSLVASSFSGPCPGAGDRVSLRLEPAGIRFFDPAQSHPGQHSDLRRAVTG